MTGRFKNSTSVVLQQCQINLSFNWFQRKGSSVVSKVFFISLSFELVYIPLTLKHPLRSPRLNKPAEAVPQEPDSLKKKMRESGTSVQGYWNAGLMELLRSSRL